MQSQCLETEKAARREPKAAMTTITPTVYQPPRPPVKPQLLPGRRDRAPAQPPMPAPRPSTSRDGTAFGLLVLMLSARARELPAPDARRGWALAECWLGKIVNARLAEVAV